MQVDIHDPGCFESPHEESTWPINIFKGNRSYYWKWKTICERSGSWESLFLIYIDKKKINLPPFNPFFINLATKLGRQSPQGTRKTLLSGFFPAEWVTHTNGKSFCPKKLGGIEGHPPPPEKICQVVVFRFPQRVQFFWVTQKSFICSQPPIKIREAIL